MTTNDFDLVPTHLAIKAMRDNGYRNTAYAVAELIDNSLQAGASHVELLCGEEEQIVTQRRRDRIQKLAVLDNGTGMDANTLRMALQFGNGSRLDDRTGIGRFGMGLPSASISQCKRVDVWSWTKGPDAALYTYIDLDEVESSGLRAVPQPQTEKLPVVWRKAAKAIGDSGTLVVWSQLDRCMWVKAQTVIDRSQFVIGRMYRRFLDEGDASIRMASFKLRAPEKPVIDIFAKSNDPMYLMTPSSTPSPYNDQPMFEPDGESWEQGIKLADEDGVPHNVTMRFTVARDEVRAQRNAGATPHGKHARDNIGVSLMRAGRELELDQSLVNGYDPRERWWGVEIDFPPALDELFGVTNNKQSARNFSEITANIENLLADENRSVQDIKEELEEAEDPARELVEVVHLIERRLRHIRQSIQIQAKGQKGAKQRYAQDSAEAQATEITKKRQQAGHRGASDDDEQLPPEERQAAIEKELVETGLTTEQAHSISLNIVQNGLKYTFAQGEMESGAFFNVKPVAGEIIIKINISHPAYSNLVEVLEDEIDENVDAEELVVRLQRANKGLKLLLMAWARAEDEEQIVERREALQDMRTDWGRVARLFLRGS